MPAVAEKRHFSPAEYLELEQSADYKSEYFEGEIFAMAGGTVAHARIIANLTAAVGGALKGGPCAAFSSDLMVAVSATSLRTYPDLTIICGEVKTDPETPVAATNPTTIIEVLSDSTEAYDRGKKFHNYLRLPSLREYILVSQNEPRIEWFHRQADGNWALGAVEGLEGDFAFPELGVAVAMADVYAGVNFPEPPAPGIAHP
ncbi:MAG: Uma2 family endonuclease [Verrucomicrobiales bacterium]